MTATTLQHSDDEVTAEIGRLLGAYDVFIKGILEALGSVPMPDPMAMPSHIVLTALLLKVLRLADSVRGLVMTGHGRDVAGTLRAQLQAFVNVKFICRYRSPEAASARYLAFTAQVRSRMKRHIQRRPRKGEVFPHMTPKQWAALEAGAEADQKRIAKAMRERRVRPMKPHRPGRRADGRRKKPVDTWTGMTDEELFARVGERDMYRFYSLYSQDLHANAGGLGSIVREVNMGIVNVNDLKEANIAVGMAARTAQRAVEEYVEHFNLGLDDRLTQNWKTYEAASFAHTQLQRLAAKSEAE